ncbi:MAG: MoxR family ATPase [Bacillota bacterium]
MDIAELTLPRLREGFKSQSYIADDDIVVPVYLALKLGKPLLVEGAPGVGKTEIAKVLSGLFGFPLVRLQCYEGLDENKALYEWNYQKQLIRIQIVKDRYDDTQHVEDEIFSDAFLLERPLLRAIRSPRRSVLLIDEVDRTDEQFEAFLFEVLSDFQVSIPEMGTLVARHIPIVVLTSNRSRELSDALKRRCLFLFIDYPSVEKETRILKAKVPEAGDKLAEQVAAAVHRMRSMDNLKKKPSIAESLDWTRGLLAMGASELDAHAVRSTLNLVIKHKDDLSAVLEKGCLCSLMEASRRAER